MFNTPRLAFLSLLHRCEKGVWLLEITTLISNLFPAYHPTLESPQDVHRSFDVVEHPGPQ